MAHRIRLGPPWDVAALEDGTFRHVRRFGRPTLPDAAERIWLVSELPAGAEVSLNGAALEVATEFAADVTDRLQPRNELVVLVPSHDAPTGVALEIR